MKAPRVFILFGASALLLSACGRAAVDAPVALMPTSIVAATEAAALVTAAPTAAQAAMTGDAAAGAALFTEMIADANFACSNCHNTSADRLIGPGLAGIGHRAANRPEYGDSVAYLRASIVMPNDVVIEGFPENLMPQMYGDVFTEAQLNDLIAYLMTL